MTDDRIKYFNANQAPEILGAISEVRIQENDFVQELLSELTGQLVNRYSNPHDKENPVSYVIEIPIPAELSALKTANIEATGEYSVFDGHQGRFPLRGVKTEYEIRPYTPSKEEFASKLANAIAKKRGLGENSTSVIKRDILSTLGNYLEQDPSKSL